MRTIYLDNAATTPLLSDALDAMMPYMVKNFYNPSAHYKSSFEIANVIKSSATTIANTIGCDQSEIFFTSGGTESDNWALRFAKPNQHIITSAIEHHAILNTCKWLEKQGVEVTYLNVDSNGMVSERELSQSIKDNTVLVSIMMANNEIGTIQHIKELAEIAAYYNVVFHTDAVQAYGHIPIDVNEFGIDMMSVSGHKFNGPKGVGFLYVSNRIPLKPMIFGGEQQSGKRAGTYNVPGIVGMTKAAEIAHNSIEMNYDIVAGLRDYFQSRILNNIDNISINGDMIERLPNNLNISFDGIRGEQLLELLSMDGIYASTGSACNSSLNEPSHVLKAIGLTDQEANSSIRFTLSTSNTIDEINHTIDVLKQHVCDLRSINND